MASAKKKSGKKKSRFSPRSLLMAKWGTLLFVSSVLAPNAEPLVTDFPAQSVLDQYQREIGIDSNGTAVDLKKFHRTFKTGREQLKVLVPQIHVPFDVTTCEIEVRAQIPAQQVHGFSLWWKDVGSTRGEGIGLGHAGSALFNFYMRKFNTPEALAQQFINCDNRDSSAHFGRFEIEALTNYKYAGMWGYLGAPVADEMELTRKVVDHGKARKLWTLDIHDEIKVSPVLASCFEKALGELTPKLKDSRWIKQNLPVGVFVNLIAVERGQLETAPPRGVLTKTVRAPGDTLGSTEAQIYLLFDPQGGCDLNL